MTREEFEEVFDSNETNWDGDSAWQGLQILSKYTDFLIQGADHDIIYSCDVDYLIEKGITKEDAESLRKLNWMIHDGEYMACYV